LASLAISRLVSSIVSPLVPDQEFKVGSCVVSQLPGERLSHRLVDVGPGGEHLLIDADYDLSPVLRVVQPMDKAPVLKTVDDAGDRTRRKAQPFGDLPGGQGTPQQEDGKCLHIGYAEPEGGCRPLVEKGGFRARFLAEHQPPVYQGFTVRPGPFPS
jgi:hypothetical protein